MFLCLDFVFLKTWFKLMHTITILNMKKILTKIIVEILYSGKKRIFWDSISFLIDEKNSNYFLLYQLSKLIKRLLKVNIDFASISRMGNFFKKFIDEVQYARWKLVISILAELWMELDNRQKYRPVTCSSPCDCSIIFRLNHTEMTSKRVFKLF